MQTYTCKCGARLFFENTLCTACGCEVGWCEHCAHIVPLESGDDSGHRCGRPECGVALTKCFNYSHNNVCNRCVPTDSLETTHAGGAEPKESGEPPPHAEEKILCRSCALTGVIPDLTLEINLRLWGQLEAAKRRLLFQLDELGLAYDAVGGAQPPLSFEFKASTEAEPVHTGHVNGVVTINLDEADPVKRETVRQQFHEPHRTLIGHFRHEVAHYYWMTLVDGRRDAEFVEIFGDPNSPPYGDALSSYHQNGPPADWSTRFISAYASAHPWEDFAETFAYYLDMRSVVATAAHHLPNFVTKTRSRRLEDLLADYHRLGLIVNELNRVMGLTDLLPEVVAAPVKPKLEFCHALVDQK